MKRTSVPRGPRAGRCPPPFLKNSLLTHPTRPVKSANSHARYDIRLRTNGAPCVQVELKTLGISPRRAMEQIVCGKNDPRDGYTKTPLCFPQLFIVSNRTETWYFAKNNARHFAETALALAA